MTYRTIGAMSAAPPLVSVVMCTYNARPYIEAAVRSVTNQTFTNWELVISDDGSTDGTREWLQEFAQHPQIRLFLQDHNLGYVHNKNFAHRQARGTYITQQDNDDLCTPDRLQRQIAVVFRYPEVKLVACGYDRIDMAGNKTDSFGPEQDVLLHSPSPRPYPFWFPSLLVHRSVFGDIGWFDPYFAGVMGDDLYWTVRAHERYPIFCLQSPLYAYRFNPESITNVLDRPRKMIITAVMSELFRQRRERGSDWLEQRDFGALARYEQQLMENREYMAEQYRTWAAKSVDKRDFGSAAKLLRQAVVRGGLTIPVLKTGFYLARGVLLAKQQ